MRTALFLFAVVAAVLIYGRWSNPPSPYSVTVPVVRERGIEIEVYDPKPRIVQMGTRS